MEEAISSKAMIDPVMLSLLGGNKDANKPSTTKSPGYVIYIGYRLKRHLTPVSSPTTPIQLTSVVKKHLSLIESLKKLGIKKVEKKKAKSLRKKDQINKNIKHGLVTERQEEIDLDEELFSEDEAWRRRLSKDVIPGRGTGEYEIEDLYDYDYGRALQLLTGDESKPQEVIATGDEDWDGVPFAPEDEADDDKMLEELENKHLLFKLETLEETHQDLKQRIEQLQSGETTIDKRLSTLEDSFEKLRE